MYVRQHEELKEKTKSEYALTVENKSLMKANKELRTMLSDHQTMLCDHQTLAKNLQKELEATKNTVTQLVATNTQLQMQIEKTISVVSNTEKQVEDLKAQNGVLLHEKEERQMRHMDQNTLEATMSDLEEIVADLNTKVQIARGDKAQAQERTLILKAKVDEQSLQISELNAEHEKILEEKMELLNRIAGLNSKLQISKEETSTAHRKIKDLEIKVADRTFCISELSRELDTALEEQRLLEEKCHANIETLRNDKVHALKADVKLMFEKDMREHFDEELKQLKEEKDREINKYKEENENLCKRLGQAELQAENDRHWECATLRQKILQQDHIIVRLTLEKNLALEIKEVEKVAEKYQKLKKPPGEQKQKKRVLEQKKPVEGALEDDMSNSSDVVTSLTQEWEEYYKEKEDREKSSQSLLKREVEHLVKSVRENTFLLGGCMADD